MAKRVMHKRWVARMCFEGEKPRMIVVCGTVLETDKQYRIARPEYQASDAVWRAFRKGFYREVWPKDCYEIAEIGHSSKETAVQACVDWHQLAVERAEARLRNAQRDACTAAGFKNYEDYEVMK